MPGIRDHDVDAPEGFRKGRGHALDRAAIPHIEKFVKDTRIVASGDEDDVAVEAELGELAQDAIASLEAIEEAMDDED